MTSTPPPIAGLDVVGLVRQARRRADASQRELAERAGVAASTVGRIEAGSLIPSLTVLVELLAVADIRLVALGPDRRMVQPMLDAPDHNLRDGAGRRYPSHLDVIIDPTGYDWWGGRYGLARPPETFLRDRERRDVQRRRSRWEVRVALLRHVPPPPTVAYWARSRAQRPPPYARGARPPARPGAAVPAPRAGPQPDRTSDQVRAPQLHPWSESQPDPWGDPRRDPQLYPWSDQQPDPQRDPWSDPWPDPWQNPWQDSSPERGPAG